MAGEAAGVDRGVKIVLALGVLLGGIGLAMLFRRPSVPSRLPNPASDERLVLRQPSGAEPENPVVVDRLTAQIAPPDEVVPGPQPTWPPAAGPADAGPGGPPPSLARSYPSFSGQPAESPSMTRSAERSPGERSGEPARTHKIVDGDTLHTLAERYLGDANRYLEIYEANRDVLPSPEMLPIGVQLRIPGRRRGHRPVDRGPDRPLVPVTPSPRPAQPN
jgi:hypothetical protein